MSDKQRPYLRSPVDDLDSLLVANPSFSSKERLPHEHQSKKLDDHELYIQDSNSTPYKMNSTKEKSISSINIHNIEDTSDCSDNEVNNEMNTKFLTKKRRSPSFEKKENFMKENFPMISDKKSLFYPFRTKPENYYNSEVCAKIERFTPYRSLNFGAENKSISPKCLWSIQMEEKKLDDLIDHIYKEWPYDICSPNMEKILIFINLCKFDEKKIFEKIDDLIMDIVKETMSNYSNLQNCQYSKYNLRASSYDSYYYY